MAIEAIDQVKSKQVPASAGEVTDLTLKILEKRAIHAEMAKGLLEISCKNEGISVDDYANNLDILGSRRARIISAASKLNEELGSPIAGNVFRNVFLLPPLPDDVP